MVAAMIAEAVIIVVLLVVLDRSNARCMRLISAQNGIPDTEKPSRTRVISPYKRPRTGGDSE